MKFVFTLLLLFLLQHACIAQFDKVNKNDSLKILNAKYSYCTLDINKNEHATMHLPYDNIEFKDVRYDTSFIAIMYPLINFSNTFNRKINLTGGFAQNVSSYFNSYYATGKNDEQQELVCYIKKFSVTFQSDVLEHFNSGNLHDDVANLVSIEIECYLKKGDKLFPVTRLDTSYLHRFPQIILNMSSILKGLLQPLMNKMENIHAEQVIQRKAYTQEEITNRYESRFNIHVLKDTEYKKGVYRTFNEFKNNSPSIDSFSITTEKVRVRAGNASAMDETALLLKALQKKSTVVFLYNGNDELISPSEIFVIYYPQTASCLAVKHLSPLLVA